MRLQGLGIIKERHKQTQDNTGYVITYEYPYGKEVSHQHCGMFRGISLTLCLLKTRCILFEATSVPVVGPKRGPRKG